jgi:hypothetical protein
MTLTMVCVKTRRVCTVAIVLGKSLYGYVSYSEDGGLSDYWGNEITTHESCFYLEATAPTAFFDSCKYACSISTR